MTYSRRKVTAITEGKTSKKKSSHQRSSIIKGALRNFAKFAGKHLWQSLFFNKAAGLGPKPATLLKRRL